jgi:hypothetical protein
MVEAKLNFFLIGAPKAGTTLIHERLSLHTQVYLSPIKEPNYYSTDIQTEGFSKAFKANTPDDLELYFNQKPLLARQVAFVRDAAQYAALFEEARPEHRVVGECSTSYLNSLHAPEKVAASHPEAAILIALRNPVERLFSHWQMARKYGFTDLPLMAAVAADQVHPNPGWGSSELFVESGLYAEALQRWRQYFPEHRIKVVLNEHLNDDRTWFDLAQWLALDGGIPDAPPAAGNRAGRARFEGINHWLTRSGLKPAVTRWLPKGVKAAVGRKWYTSEGLPQMTAQERAALYPLFAEDIRELEAMTGMDLQHWRIAGQR